LNTFSGAWSGYSNDNGYENTFNGADAGYANISGVSNAFSGAWSGYSNDNGSRNTFSGANSGVTNVDGNDNTFIGNSSGYSNDHGEQNTFIGASSGFGTDNGTSNVFAGYYAGYGNLHGSYNILLGENAGTANGNANANTIIGFEAGKTNIQNNNVFLGYQSGYSNVQGSENTFSGYQSGYTNSSGNLNSYFGYQAGKGNTTGHDNAFLGYKTGYTNTTADNNVFIGNEAGTLSNTDDNVYIGYRSGFTNGSGEENTFVGSRSGYLNSTGKYNSFFGFNAGQANSTGTENSFFGFHSGNGSTTGSKNTYMGWKAGYYNITGNENTSLGYFASGFNYNCSKNTCVGTYAAAKPTGGPVGGNENTIMGAYAMYNMNSGDRNTIVGSYSGYNYETGDDNVFVGYQAGNKNAGGNVNTFIGENSGYYNVSGSNNTFIGDNSGVNSGGPTNLTNASTLGHNAFVKNSNHMILGDNSVYVGMGLSADGTGPQSRLEINSKTSGTAYDASAHSGSGLQFRQLRSTSDNHSSNYEAPYGKVLTVDDHGIVKLTDAFGYGVCNNFTTLPADLAMKLSDYRIFYEGQSNTDPNVGMINSIALGYPVCTGVLPGKLSVDQTWTSSAVYANTIAGYFHNGDFSQCSNSQIAKTGVVGVSDGYSRGSECEAGLLNIGGDFFAINSENGNIGVVGKSLNPRYSALYNTGGFFIADDARVSNFGVAAESWGSNSGAMNYGVYAYAPAGICSTGGWGSCVQAAGFFNGDLYSVNALVVSDARLKDNVMPLENNISIIKQLNPKSYTFKTNQFPNHSLPNGTQSGLIAQEVYTVLPHLIKGFRVPARRDSSGNVIDTTGTGETFMAVNYDGLIPYLIGAIKEQQESIDSMRTALAEAQSEIDNCCSGSGSTHRHSLNVEVSDVNEIILNQNSPNPFSEETYITYSIPESVSKAMIVIYDNRGTILKRIAIEERGEGSIHVFAEKLSSGIYSYSLVADGVTIDTKQMVCSK
jgi:hypothetical protein